MDETLGTSIAFPFGRTPAPRGASHPDIWKGDTVDRESRMVSVTLPESAWRGIHACLLELCHTWEDRTRPAGMPEPGEKEVSILLERIVPVLSLASAWPDVADFEARVRRMWDMPVPEHMLEKAREMVRTVPQESPEDDSAEDDSPEDDSWADDSWQDGEAA